MHDLLVLRHAQAEPATPGMSDLERALTAHGLAQADAAGHWLATHAPHPERILCSPARRTRMTLDRVLQAMDWTLADAPATFAPAIHEATPGTLMALLDQHDEASCVWLIGHNPGLEHLVALLCQGRTPGFRGMPSAALAHIRVDGPVEPGNGRLLDFRIH